MKALALLLLTQLTCAHAVANTSNPTHSLPERTLWQLCWDEAGEPSFPSDVPPHTPPCDNWEYPRYDSLPILVSIDYSALLSYHDVLAAVDFWNAALGHEVLQIVTSGDIRIHVFGAVPDRQIAGKASPIKILGKLHNIMTLYGKPSLSTVVHEFGHALGLGHDPGGGYIMAKYGEQRLRVHPKDLAAIRRLYGHNW